MNVGSKRLIAWNDSRHASWWRFSMHCGMEGTGSPEIIFIFCYQVVCHPSEHGTSSMGKRLLLKPHNAKLHKLTESEVSELTISMVDEMALAIMKMQGSRRIPIVCVQRNFQFHILLNQYWLKWLTQRLKPAAKHFETSEFHQEIWNHYLMVRFVPAHIPRIAISNLELQ